MIDTSALFSISYGLYIVCSGDKSKGNGFISNTVFQVTSKPAKFTICCNKNNLTADFIRRTGVFSVSVLEQDASAEIIGKFGYMSGNDIDKMAGTTVKYGDTGVPIVLSDSLAYLECTVVETIDVGTHLMFIGELVDAGILDDSKQPLTYQYYRQVRKGVSPKNAPTYVEPQKPEPQPQDALLKKYKCMACGHVYDEATEPIKFEDLPEDWKCPVCYSGKSEFVEL